MGCTIKCAVSLLKCNLRSHILVIPTRASTCMHHILSYCQVNVDVKSAAFPSFNGRGLTFSWASVSLVLPLLNMKRGCGGGGTRRREKSLGCRSRKGVGRKSLRPLASSGSSLTTLAGAPTGECRGKCRNT